MPLQLEELAIKDLVKNPKLIALYAGFLLFGWVGSRLLPDDCHQEVARWQSLYYAEHRGKDSLQATKDVLYEDLLKYKHTKKTTDSLILELGKKADHIFKKRKS